MSDASKEVHPPYPCHPRGFPNFPRKLLPELGQYISEMKQTTKQPQDTSYKFRMLLSAITFIAGLALLFAALALPLRLAAQDKQDHSNDNKHHHYTPIDMGTFGGPNSGVEEGTQVVNNRVVAVGDADTSTPDPNYPTCPIFPCDPFIEHAFKWTQGVKTDLGPLPGVNSSISTWISGNGLVAGISENGLIDPLLGIPLTKSTKSRTEK